MKIEKNVCPYCGANMKILPGLEHAEWNTAAVR